MELTPLSGPNLSQTSPPRNSPIGFRLLTAVSVLTCAVTSGGVAPAEKLSAAQFNAASPPVQSAGISGRVADALGQAAPGVAVIAVPVNGGPRGHAVSRPDGTYQVDGLAKGDYFLDFDLLGFDVTRHNHVRVTAQTTAHADAVLYVTGVCDCVHVTPERPVQERLGQVLTVSGEVLPHARLQFVRPWSEVAFADRDGRFTVRVPVDGPVPLIVSESGFQSLTQQVSGTVTTPIVVRLTSGSGAGVPDTERLPRRCCPGGLFMFPGR
jgi:hypothetical protein